jgi:DMSO reductase family type II enzyme chaperone
MPADNEDVGSTLTSLDRARVYRALAGVFRAPDTESIQQARERDLPELCQALERLTEDSDSADEDDLIERARSLTELWGEADAMQLRHGHHDAFDESSGKRSAPTEMDQLDGPPQLELTRNFEMADVAGFYRAFGVEVDSSGDRVDHIAAELEFMNLLAVKESIALQQEGEGEHARVCRDASRSFLRDHLGRWVRPFAEKLAAAAADPFYAEAGAVLSLWVAHDAARLGVD